jgi:hypothetical protein
MECVSTESNRVASSVIKNFLSSPKLCILFLYDSLHCIRNAVIIKKFVAIWNGIQFYINL